MTHFEKLSFYRQGKTLQICMAKDSSLHEAMKGYDWTWFLICMIVHLSLIPWTIFHEVLRKCSCCKQVIKWLYVIIMSRMLLRMNLHSIVAWMLRNSLLETGAISDVYVLNTVAVRWSNIWKLWYQVKIFHKQLSRSGILHATVV